MKNTDVIIKEKFDEHIRDISLKNVLLICTLSGIVLLYYMYSDLFIRDSVYAFYLRLLPFALGLPLFFLSLLSKDNYKKVRSVLYNLFLASGMVMMLGICIIHLHSDALAPSVTGAVLVIFLISLEIKSDTLSTVLVYFVPLSIFTLALIFVYIPSSEEFTIMADIYPIVAAGFAINRINYRLRFRAFKSGFLLDQEKQHTEELYQETITINEDLKLKNDEIISHKEEIEEKNQKLVESNATKDRFLAIISHDLIGPFNTLMGFSELLKDSFEEEDIEEQKNYVELIHKDIHKTYKLLENLLIWSRSQKNALEFNLEKINLYLIANECIDLLKYSAEKKAINIDNQIDKKIIVDADKNMLATILRNLISNALKFTFKNGNVVLDASIKAGKKSFIEILVKDSGVGIADDIKTKLFYISKSVSTRGTEKEDGTGLGLILCKEFVDKHGGEIYVESEPGKGSTFVFTIPLFD